MTYNGKPLQVGVVQQISGGCPATPTYSTFTRLSYNDGNSLTTINYLQWVMSTTAGVTTTAQGSSPSTTAGVLAATYDFIVGLTSIGVSQLFK